MVPYLIEKLRAEFNNKITTEAQLVYLLASIRKIIEQEGETPQYQYLKFHANWALHSSLKGPFAQNILSAFNEAHIQFRDGIELINIPEPLRSKISNISGMDNFRDELSNFLHTHDLPDFRMSLEWLRFLQLYTKVIEDCPLIIRSNDNNSSVVKLTVRIQVANAHLHDQLYFKISWYIQDRNGELGEFFIINSYEDRDP